MSENPKALHPVKVAGKIITTGGAVDPVKVGPRRMARLIEKGRVDGGADGAPVNRAETASGRPAAPALSTLRKADA